MKQCSRCGEVKPLEAFSKRKASKDGLNNKCRECDAARVRAYQEANKEQRAAYDKAYYAANKEQLQAQAQAYYEANKERERKRAKGYYEANRERYLAQQKGWYEANRERQQTQRKAWGEENKEWVKAYYEANRPRRRANVRAREAGLGQATPMWADRDAIAAIYAEAARLTEETGIPHHVDHIIPLKGKGVCGLHVPWNLRAIPASENLSKGNRIPDHLIV